MRVTQPGQARAWFLDRNPTQITQNFSTAGVAPHVSVARWTYTVPAARKFVLEQWFVRLRRATVAAPVGIAFSYGLLNVTQDFLEAILETNAVGDKDRITVTPQATFLAGNVITGNTADASTGGSIDYQNTMKGTEFDA